MLYITTLSGPDLGHTIVLEWHAGEPLIDLPLVGIMEIQADGEELRIIQDLFGGTIPMTHRPVVNWAGDIARTIYLNLKTQDLAFS